MTFVYPVHKRDRQTQDTQHFLPEETMHVAFPLSYNECEEMVPGFGEICAKWQTIWVAMCHITNARAWPIARGVGAITS